MHQKAVTLRVVGFVLSLVLTLAAYLIIVRPNFFHLELKMNLMVIFILAVLQALVQLIFFINLWRERGPLWNLGVFVSTISIIVIIIAFSIWIMNHLNYNMMP